MKTEYLEEEDFFAACNDLKVRAEDVEAIKAFLSPLREKSDETLPHYLHTLRVGLLSRSIGAFVHHEERPLLFAGALHDLGKCQTCLSVLGRTGSWNDNDQREIEKHVLDGYRLLLGRFDFSAEIMVWHHRFQENGYPEVLPSPLHEYKEMTQLLIREYGRIVAIADVYDALHRVNSKTGAKKLSRSEIKQKMLVFNPDRVRLVTDLYHAGILQ